jgi:hypothetical protein
VAQVPARAVVERRRLDGERHGVVSSVLRVEHGTEIDAVVDVLVDECRDEVDGLPKRQCLDIAPARARHIDLLDVDELESRRKNSVVMVERRHYVRFDLAEQAQQALDVFALQHQPRQQQRQLAIERIVDESRLRFGATLVNGRRRHIDHVGGDKANRAIAVERRRGTTQCRVGNLAATAAKLIVAQRPVVVDEGEVSVGELVRIELLLVVVVIVVAFGRTLTLLWLL